MAVDVLSEVLSAVRLTGSVHYDVTATSPWVAETPPSADIAEIVFPGAQHTIEFHVITKGACWFSIVGGAPFEPVQLKAGDVVVIPHGEAHTLSSAPGMRTKVDMDAFRFAAAAEAQPFVFRTGAEGPEDTHIFCGFFTCDVKPFNPLIEALPRTMIFGRDAQAPSDGLLEQFIHFASSETSNKRAGTQSILNRLSELMFVEAIRTQMAQLSADTGWLAGLRDPLVGRVLALLHGKPAHPWTLEELAAESGASRSALADRFNQLMGYPPIQYLTRWRMQLAAKRLSDTGAKVAVVAQEVGYDSEAAFSRAFKKFSGRSPSEWRGGGKNLGA